MLPPFFLSLLYRDGETFNFGYTFLLTLFGGILLWLPVRKLHLDLRLREGFVIVAMFWLVLGGISSIPLHLGSHLGYIEAVFESVSAFTTTGATVITGLDELPPSLLFYRQELQWLGGLGVIVLSVAILPILGVGGMQLYKAEATGPMKDEKITPRIAHTARAFWFIYVAMTLLCAFAYWLAGMNLFDAVAHSLSTVSTGGFSTHDASIGYFNNPLIEGIAILFMLLGAINFSIHYYGFIRRKFGRYWRDTEVRVFLLVVAALILVQTTTLTLTNTYGTMLESLRHSAFNTVSVITSTGFITDDFSIWPLFLPVLLMFSGFMGGCAGSTAGGMKVIRFIMMFKQGLQELRRLVHPSMVQTLKIQGRTLQPRVLSSVWAFFALYVATFVVLMLLVMASGVDQVTAFSAVATCLNNLGPGLGEVSTNFQPLGDFAKAVLTFSMLLGRLEIFTLLVLLSPAFWRK
jgi:trk system potassium uptake protein TrkH